MALNLDPTAVQGSIGLTIAAISRLKSLLRPGSPHNVYGLIDLTITKSQYDARDEQKSMKYTDSIMISLVFTMGVLSKSVSSGVITPPINDREIDSNKNNLRGFVEKFVVNNDNEEVMEFETLVFYQRKLNDSNGDKYGYGKECSDECHETLRGLLGCIVLHSLKYMTNAHKSNL